MGNHNAKTSDNSLFPPDELKILESTFRSVSGHSDKLSQEKLLGTWMNIIDPYLAESSVNYLYCSGQQRATPIPFKRFAEPFYIVHRGTLDEKLKLIAGSVDASTNQIVIRDLENYVTSLVRSYLNIQTQKSNKALLSWQNMGFTSSDRSIQALSKAQVRSVSKDLKPKLDTLELETWLQANPTFLLIWNEVFTHLYGTHSGKTHKLGDAAENNILPHCEGIPRDSNYTPILEIPHIIFVNSNLKNEYRHKWRFLFSSKIHGESFSTMLGKITHQGPTFLIVEDEDHFIFGGFAPESWALSANFAGDDSSMLLTITPAMRCFQSTGYNNHYQYLNLNQQTMPNGLGMGGQHNYWGLWIDSEYGCGQSSESCTTYSDYLQLSKRKEFKIKNLEVWGIGDLPKLSDSSDEERGHKCSVLDKNLEDRVMLELAGKQLHSDGLREPDLDFM